MPTNHIIDNLTAADRHERYGAALALATVEPTPEVAQALVGRLGTESECNVREALTWATVQQRDVTLPLVVEALGHDDAATRAQAAHVLSKMGEPAVAGHLAAVVADADPQVAIKGFRAAASTGDPVVVPALVGRLGTEDRELADALSAAFARLGEPAVAPLVEVLGSAEPRVRQQAADALGHLGSPVADVAVTKVAALLDDPDAEVRIAAVSALGELDRTATREALAQAAAWDDAIVAAIAASLVARPEPAESEAAQA